MVPALLILLGVTGRVQTDLPPDAKFLLLPPVNFTIKVTGLAQVLLCWKPNPDQRHANPWYRVKINAPHEDDYETSSTESKCVTPLHQGFAARVQTVLQSRGSLLASSWVSAELGAPPGSPGTSIVNLTCTTNATTDNDIHLKVSLHCTWLAGKDAPEDTQYFLYYRFGPWTEECQEYSKDALNRNTACWFPRTFINSKAYDQLAVHVNGSSKYATIKPFDQLFSPRAIDRTNSPMNVTAETEGTHLSIKWARPVSAFPAHCFNYEVKIHNTKNGYSQVEKITTNAFTSTTDGISKYSIQVRAAVSPASCGTTGLWSEWSQPIYVGNDPQKSLAEWLLVVFMATMSFILLIFFLFCRIFHLWTKLFPPVPAPKSNIKELFVIPTYELPNSAIPEPHSQVKKLRGEEFVKA
ncbi:interleukin-5 receptor subunit alpha [Ctenodactylus gundi]